MTTQRIRPLVICVFSHRGRILVNESQDAASGQGFCRPLGGGIEFGETSAQALVREIREEVNAEITNLRLIGTLENIFTYRGLPEHEIVQVYDAEFLNQSLYSLAAIPGCESDGQSFQAVWRTLESISPEVPLVPKGLLQLLTSKA